MQWDERIWRRSVESFGGFLEPLVKDLGRSERREGAALYVEGLLTPGQRKSVEPMAERLGVDKQKLQQFVSDSPWEEAGLWEAMRREVVPVLGPIESWIIDETGWVKQGTKSVGVSHQYCGAVGKKANCQVSVHVALSTGEIAAPVAARLFLPQSWAGDPARRRRAGVPEEIVFASKPQIALELVRTLRAEGVASAPVLGDCQYGHSGPLREGLRSLGCEYFLQIESQMQAWTQAPVIRKARVRWSPAARQASARSVLDLAHELPVQAWRPCQWSAAGGKTHRTRLAWMRVWLWSDLNEQTGEIPPTWLIVDWPQGAAAPYHIYTAWLNKEPERIRCLRLSRQRYHIEQYFQRDKDDLGLDHFEGRSWLGFHHHLALAALAYLFVLTIFLRAKKNFSPHVGDGSARDPAIISAISRLLSLLP